MGLRVAKEAAQVALSWLSGVVAYWLGVLLARINGYSLGVAVNILGALLLALGQAWVLWFTPRWRLGLGALALGLLPIWLGFYLASGHWVSELWIVGAFLSLAALNALLTRKWQPAAGQERGWASRLALGFTGVNILLLAGLLALWHLPPPSLPLQEGIWVLVALGVINQEWVKRRFYLRPDRVGWLQSGAASFHLGAAAWLLLVYLKRL